MRFCSRCSSVPSNPFHLWEGRENETQSERHIKALMKCRSLVDWVLSLQQLAVNILDVEVGVFVIERLIQMQWYAFKVG